MVMQLVNINNNDRQNRIVNAINNFDKNYHKHYFKVRNYSRNTYLVPNNPTEIPSEKLAKILRQALIAYGAGKNSAPNVKSINDFINALLKIKIHHELRFFSNLPISELTIFNNVREITPPSTLTLNVLDAKVLNILNLLADNFFDFGNNRRTALYPMKALMLLTGRMYALDFYVRRGLIDAKLNIRNETIELPQNANGGLESNIITKLPFIISDCYSNYRDIIDEAIRQSDYPALKQDIFRVFDILLFMQGVDRIQYSTLVCNHINWVSL
jgi:hypothetical protein